MMVEAKSVCIGRCYVTHDREVRKVLDIEDVRLTYVTRGKLAFPSWDQELWRVTTRDAFASEVEREVPCDWSAP